MSETHSAWVEVSRSAIRHNVAEVRKAIGEGVRLMAVVKADGYGHGLVGTAKEMVDAGADALAVTRLDEAALLRTSGITCDVLVFESILPEMAAEAIRLDVDLTVCTPELVEALGSAAIAADETARVHLKIDSGMGRLGVLPGDAVGMARKISETEGVVHVGTYTHFATSSEKDLTYARAQLANFNIAVQAIRNAGLEPGHVHAANSAAILRMPDSHFDMVRPGTILYGQYPSSFVPRSLALKDTWQLKARISYVKSVPAGLRIGYGSEFRAKRESRIAVIPLGWADGLTLAPESVFRRSIAKVALSRYLGKPVLRVKIGNKWARVVGRIAMQMCSVDVTKIPAKVGDEVVIPSRRVTTNPLIPRVYID
jgi:alanine racemase